MVKTWAVWCLLADGVADELPSILSSNSTTGGFYLVFFVCKVLLDLVQKYTVNGFFYCRQNI